MSYFTTLKLLFRSHPRSCPNTLSAPTLGTAGIHKTKCSTSSQSNPVGMHAEWLCLRRRDNDLEILIFKPVWSSIRNSSELDAYFILSNPGSYVKNLKLTLSPRFYYSPKVQIHFSGVQKIHQHVVITGLNKDGRYKGLNPECSSAGWKYLECKI